MWRPIIIKVDKRPCEQVREGHTTRGGSTSRPFFDPPELWLTATAPTVGLAEVNSIQWAPVGLFSFPITVNEDVDDSPSTAIVNSDLK